MNRVYNAVHNVIGNLMINLVNIALQFVSRTIFISFIGIKYLGISGLFTSIITILNLMELGVGSAFVFSLYEPLEKEDKPHIIALMTLYKKCYRFIGVAILLIGLMFTPLVKTIIPTSVLGKNIYGIYFLFLLQTVFSYWFMAYRTAIIDANQKGYLLAKLHCICNIVGSILKVLMIIFTKNYGIYIATGIICSCIQSLLVAARIKVLYPYISSSSSYVISRSERKKIKKNVVGLSLYKISGTVLTSTDTIILSIYLGITVVGVVDNYTTLIKTAIGLLMIVFGSYTSSIGNLYITESKERVEYIFRCLGFANFWLFGFVGITIYIMINPFITLWIGNQYTLSNLTVFVIFLNVVTAGLQNAVIAFKDGCGLFWEGKYRPLVSAILNIILSLVLVRALGVTGVILGTIISRFLSTWWYDALLVYHHAFNKSPKRYYKRYLCSLVVITMTALSLRGVQYYIFNKVTVGNFFVMVVLCFLIPNGVFFIYGRHMEEYKYYLELFRKIVCKIRRRKKICQSNINC